MSLSEYLLEIGCGGGGRGLSQDLKVRQSKAATLGFAMILQQHMSLSPIESCSAYITTMKLKAQMTRHALTAVYKLLENLNWGGA